MFKTWVKRTDTELRTRLHPHPLGTSSSTVTTHISMQQLISTFHSRAAQLEPFAASITLAQIGVTLSLATADCERGFSLMNRLKTALRNRLGNITLEQIMLIATHGPASITHWDAAPAVEMWLAAHKRRGKFA